MNSLIKTVLVIRGGPPGKGVGSGNYQHHKRAWDTPVSTELVTTPAIAGADTPEAITKFENDNWNAPIEHAIATKNGKTVFSESGTTRTLAIKSEYESLMQGAIFHIFIPC